MRQQTLPITGPVTVSVDNVGGDLQIVGWERAEITAKTDDSQLDLQADAETIHVRSRGDLILYVARDVIVHISRVGGDADLRAIAGSMEIAAVGGDLQMRNLGGVHVHSVGGDMSLRSCTGDLLADSIGGDASLHEIKGDVHINVGSDLYLRGAEGNVIAKVGSDAALYLHPKPGTEVNVQAGSDALLRLPAKADVELSLQGCDDESIRVDLPGVVPAEIGLFRSLVIGNGGAKISLVAGSEVIVTSRDEEWENMAEFDPLGRDGPFAAGEFPGLSSDLHASISRRVEQATRRALESSMRAQEQSDRVQRRVDAAMRRAEEKMRSTEQRSMHMGIKVGRFGVGVESPRPPMPPRVVPDPVSDEERLVILKMLQDKKISLQDAEKLLSALEGK